MRKAIEPKKPRNGCCPETSLCAWHDGGAGAREIFCVVVKK